MYYKHHIFFCTNKKSNELGCGNLSGDESAVFAKTYLKSVDMWGEGKCRATKSGCLGRCSEGPICVVYPDGVWYTYVDEADVQEILNKHLIQGKVVKRLQI